MKVLDSIEEIDKFLEDFGYGSDACLDSAALKTGTSVDEDGSMSFSLKGVTLQLLLHRQVKGAGAVALFFEGVESFRFSVEDDFDKIIQSLRIVLGQNSITVSAYDSNLESAIEYFQVVAARAYFEHG